MAERTRTLGAILAGGRNRRFGSHKALTVLGGRRIIDRVSEAVAVAAQRVVVVANEPELYGDVATEVRPDAQAGLGALGGIHSAVRWARDVGCEVALTVACDMPFVSGELLARLVEVADSTAAVLPASDGPRGLEPLCAAYGTGCLAAIEAAIERGERAVVSFFDDVDLRILDAAEVARHGQAEHMFMNVNRPRDLVRAEGILASRGEA